jgi:spore germination protein (amino acid permease)
MQFFFIAITSAFGSSMLTLPRVVAKIAREDMWMSVLVGGIPIIVALWVAVKLAAYFPDHIAVEYHRILLGDVLGTALNVFMVVVMLLVASVMVRTFAVGVRIYLLDSTPPLVTVSIILLPAVYAVQYGLMPILRTIQMLFLPGFGLFGVIILLGFLSVDSTNYLPVLARGLTPVVKAALPTWFAYTGPELAIGLLYPFITRPRSIFRFGMAAILFLTVIYVVIMATTQGILGHDETTQLLVPTVMAYRSVEIPDTFIERLDGYLMIVWIILAFCATILWVYLTAFTIGKMLKLEYMRPVVALIVPLMILIVHAPPDSQTAEAVGQWTNLLSLFWSLVILPLLLFLAWRKAKRRRVC